MGLVRRLTGKGIAEFREFLQTIRAGGEFQPNPALLYVGEHSAPLEHRLPIEPRVFTNKFDAASYLHSVLTPIDSARIVDDEGLWSWLALFYFDQLSPHGIDGKRRPRADYHYIPGGRWGHQRHLLAGPYRLYDRYRDHSRLLLHPAVHQHGEFVLQLGYRRDLLANRGLIEAIDLLYWDPQARRPKRGATSPSRAGNLRRLIAVVQQLDFNYDLYGMDANEIVSLLPEEFAPWKPSAPPARRRRGEAVDVASVAAPERE